MLPIDLRKCPSNKRCFIFSFWNILSKLSHSRLDNQHCWQSFRLVLLPFSSTHQDHGSASMDQEVILAIPGVLCSWFWWRCTRSVDRENHINNDQSPARDSSLCVCHRFSFIVICHDIDRSTAAAMQCSWQRLDSETAANAHMSTCRPLRSTGIAIIFLDRAAFG